MLLLSPSPLHGERELSGRRSRHGRNVWFGNRRCGFDARLLCGCATGSTDLWCAFGVSQFAAEFLGGHHQVLLVLPAAVAVVGGSDQQATDSQQDAELSKQSSCRKCGLADGNSHQRNDRWHLGIQKQSGRDEQNQQTQITVEQMGLVGRWVRMNDTRLSQLFSSNFTSRY